MKTAESYSQTSLETHGISRISDRRQEQRESAKPGIAEDQPCDLDPLLHHIIRAKREWEATLDAVSDLILLTDPKGTIVRCNRAVQEALQTPYRELIGRSVEEVFSGRADAVLSVFQANGSTGKNRQEVQFPRLPGWFAVTRHPIRARETGGIHGVVYTLTDITERKRAEEALQQEVQITSALVRVGRELIATLEPSALLHRFCQLTCELLDCEASHTFLLDPTDQTYKAVASAGDTPEQWVAISVLSIPLKATILLLNKLEREEVVQLKTTAYYAGMPELLRQLDVSAALCVALRREGKIVGIQVASYRGRRRGFSLQQERIAKGTAQVASLALENAWLLEETARANRFKSEFLAAMSHELRTPLNIILGYTELLLEGDFGRVSAEQAECLRRVEKSAEQLLELINTTLDVSRLETHRLHLELSDIDITAFIEALRQETTPLSREKPELQIVWKVALGLPPLYTDPTKLKVIIKHVFHNAVKFTECGSITVDVYARDAGIVICIADTGCGIAPETLPVIFEMFRQGEDVLTRRYGGVGIGLYVVQQLLNLLGGTITVESEVGQGSTFRIWVPSQEKPAPNVSSQTRRS
jgi:PAS domain S-box-containing protein